MSEIELNLIELTKEEQKVLRMAVEGRMTELGRQGASQDYDSRYAALPFDLHQALQTEYRTLTALRERLV